MSISMTYLSQYKLDVVREIKQRLKHNPDTNEFSLRLGPLFPEFEPDSTVHFSNYNEASIWIIKNVVINGESIE